VCGPRAAARGPGGAVLGRPLQREPRRKRARALASTPTTSPPAARRTAALAEEAKTSRVALAVKMAKAGKAQHLEVAREALADPTAPCATSPPCSWLPRHRGRQGRGTRAARDPGEGRRTRTSWSGQSSPRAPRSSALLRGPLALPRRGAREAAWVRVRIYEKGASKPGVLDQSAVALADLVFKSLPDDAVADLRKEGYDARTFWERSRRRARRDPHDRGGRRRAQSRSGSSRRNHEDEPVSRGSWSRRSRRLPPPTVPRTDLQLVKKAVASSQVAPARPPAEEPLPPRAQAAPAAHKARPCGSGWDRREGNKRAKVSVNLPLGIVRSLVTTGRSRGAKRCRQDQH